MANSAHGLIKIACRDIDGQAPLTEHWHREAIEASESTDKSTLMV